MALTLRLNEAQEKQIEDLKEQYVIGSSSKAVLFAVRKVLNDIPKLQKRALEAEEHRKVIEHDLQTLIVKTLAFFDSYEKTNKAKKEIKDLINYKPLSNKESQNLQDESEQLQYEDEFEEKNP